MQLTVAEILNRLDEYPEVMVELTGGEPLLQGPVYPLMDRLLERGRTILLETNGSLSIDHVSPQVSVILDIKCPGSDMHDRMNWDNVPILKQRRKKGARDEIKFVLTSRQDFGWAAAIIEKHELSKVSPILFSPVSESLKPAVLADLILQYRLPVTMQLQLHKIIWPEQNRGV